MNILSSGVQISHGGLVLLRPPERQHDGGEGPYVLAIRYLYYSPFGDCLTVYRCSDRTAH